jgi:hypothetical protein
VKKILLILLFVVSVLVTPARANAVVNSAFYVDNAYFKGNSTYDIVVHDSKRDTLRLYVNDKKSKKAAVNSQGWATFQKVKLAGQSKLSFTKKVGLFKYSPIKYVNHIYVNSSRVELSDVAPKHSYDDFSKWLAATVTYQPKPPLPGDQVTRFNLIRTECGTGNGFDDAVWIACMQNGYKDYLKPEIFVGQENQTTALDLIGFVDFINQYGTSRAFSDYTQKDIDSHVAIYSKFAVTR